ncbi:hypothetical protein K438DRAFT_2030542 [Mycena galopus ATCC 62051]|nr:hypothetical protein K438DRAFT_2030542 [Mycena galopus ATCC 62051]
MLPDYTTKDDLDCVLRILARKRQNLHTGGVTLTHRCAELNPQLSAKSKEKIQHALENAWADSTIKKYAYGLDAFHKFCDNEHVPHGQRLPACEELLCAFAASRAGEIAGGTQGGIRLRYTLKGVENLAPDESRRDQRPPVTKEMVDMLGRSLNLTDAADAAVYATACCAFWGQVRLGEILSETQGSYKIGRIPLVSDLSNPVTDAGTRILRLPFTKTKGARGDNSILCRQSFPSDPIKAVENHLAVNSIPGDLPLFSHRTTTGSIICLTRRKFLQRCNTIWAAHNIPTITGHSFRIGGTTELLLAGVNPDVVQAMGCWLSDAFLVYWRHLDLLAPLHAEFLSI